MYLLHLESVWRAYYGSLSKRFSSRNNLEKCLVWEMPVQIWWTIFVPFYYITVEIFVGLYSLHTHWYRVCGPEKQTILLNTIVDIQQSRYLTLIQKPICACVWTFYPLALFQSKTPQISIPPLWRNHCIINGTFPGNFQVCWTFQGILRLEREMERAWQHWSEVRIRFTIKNLKLC